MFSLKRCYFTSLISLLYVALCPSAQARSLAFSFDDGVNPALNTQAIAINQAILSTLQASQLHAILFPAISKTGDYAGLKLVADWGKQGHLIGNHTYSHHSLNAASVSLEQFIEDTRKAETLLKPLPGWTARLRFPYLKEGDTTQKRDGMRQWLQQQHYQSGAVSIDASDWFYNLKYLQLLKQQDSDKLQQLKQLYIQHLLDRAEYYDQLALKTLRRSPQHVLLLHTNAINAAFLPDVINAFKQQHWQLIDAKTAFNDPLYHMQSDTLPAGESILWALAKQQGIEDLRYPAEDSVYEEPLLKQAGL